MAIQFVFLKGSRVLPLSDGLIFLGWDYLDQLQRLDNNWQSNKKYQF